MEEPRVVEASRLLLDGKKRGGLASRWIEFVSTRLFGQPRIVEAFAEVSERIEAGIRHDERPIATILLYGSSGAGKTEAVKVFTDFLLDSRNAFIRLNGPDYSEKHDVSNLKGAPKSYIGFDEDPEITQEKLDAPGFKKFFREWRESLSLQNRKKIESLEKEHAVLMFMRQEMGSELVSLEESLESSKEKEARLKAKKEIERQSKALKEAEKRLNEIWKIVEKMGYPVYDPYEGNYPSVLLIDEIEKAHRFFHNVLLRVSDEGELEISVSQKSNRRNGQGGPPHKRVRFKNTIIIGTANCGEEEIAKLLRILGGKDVQIGFGTGSLSFDEVDKAIYEIGKKEMVKYFSAPFIGRLDYIIAARPPSVGVLKEILEKEIRELQANFVNRWNFPLLVQFSAEARDFIIRESSDKLEEGARLLRKKVQHYITSQLARFKNSGQIAKGDVIDVGLGKDGSGEPELVFYRLPRNGKSFLVMKK